MDRKYYLAILGLNDSATREDIKMAYRKLAKQYHPDRTQGDDFLQGMFVKIQEAYEFLMKDEAADEFVNTANQPNESNTHETCMPLVDDYIRLQDRYRDVSSLQKRFKEQFRSSPVSWKIIASRFFVFLILLSFFYPDRLSGDEKNDFIGDSLKDTIPLEVFYQPNIQSKVLMRKAPKDILDTVGTTRYFYKVRVQDSSKRIKTGYILKHAK